MVLLVTSLLSSTAQAAESEAEMRLSFQVSDEQVPTHVCIVTETAGDTNKARAVHTLDLGKGKSRPDLCSTEGGCGDKLPKGWQRGELYFKDSNVRAPEPIKALYEERNEHRCNYGGTGCRPRFSLRGFEMSKSNAPFDATMSCVANETNTPGTPGRGLVLGLKAQHQGDQGPYLRDIKLDGRRLTITVKRLDGIGHLARVLGGFYAPIGEVYLAPEHEERTLALESRCQWTTLGIPPVASRVQAGPAEGDVEIRLSVEHGTTTPDNPNEGKSKDNHQCWSGSLQGTSLRLLIPYEPRGNKILSIHENDALWKLQANWYGARPSPNAEGEGEGGADSHLDMSVQKLSFSWRSDPCLYPKGKCPEARISTSHTKCKNNNKDKELDEGGLCHYTCGAGSSDDDRPLDFPTKIAFFRNTNDDQSTPEGTRQSYLSWSVDIHTVGETLEGYVDPSERLFEVEIDWKNDDFADEAQRPTLDELRREICPARWSHDDVHAIEFSTGPGSDEPRVELYRILGCGAYQEEEEQRRQSEKAKGAEQAEPSSTSTGGRPMAPTITVKLPNISCRQPIRYQYVGERSYESRFGQVENGKLRVHHPMASAKRLHYSFAIFPVSFQWIMSRSHALGRVHWAPAAEASLVWKARRHGKWGMRGWRFNADFTFIGAQHPYLPIGDEPNQTSDDPEAELYARWFGGFSFLSPWIRSQHKDYGRTRGARFAVGTGAAIGWGHPFRRSDFEALGFRPRRPQVMFRGDVRIKLWRHFEAVVSPRVVLSDGPVSYSTDLSGQPRQFRPSPIMVSSFVPFAGLAAIW